MVDHYDGYVAIVLREAELDGTQAIADALEIKDEAPPLTFNNVAITHDKYAPLGSVCMVNTDLMMYVGNGEWRKVA